MEKKEILQKIKEKLNDEFKIQEDQITEDATFMEDLGLDSLDISTLLQDVETMFDVRIPDDDLDSIQTVGDLVEYLHKKLQ